MKINRNAWIAAGIAGALVGFIPLMLVLTVLKDGLGFEVLLGLRPMFFGLLFGGWGGAFAYHKMTFGGNKW